jgi:hypothetical protein
VTVLAETVRVGRLREREGLLYRQLEATGLVQRRRLVERLESAALAPAADLDTQRGGAEVGDRGDPLRVASEGDEICARSRRPG